MNVVEEIELLVSTLSKLDSYNETLNSRLSKCDLAICDLMHYIENEKLDARKMCKVVKELKKIRIERRKIKNDKELLRVFETNKGKLNNNYEFLMNEIMKTKKRLETTYQNRIYSTDFKEIYEEDK